MATARVVINEAARALGYIRRTDDLAVDDLDDGLDAVQSIMLDLHNNRGPMRDVDVSADYAPAENQRVRIQAGFSVAITFPNSVQLWNGYDPYDYGFTLSPSLYPDTGLASGSDGIYSRQPRDGARIEIVGTTQALYFYRADLNAWLPATGLIYDAEVPLNERYRSALVGLVAERLAPILEVPVTPELQRRIASAHVSLAMQIGTARDPVRATYF